MKAAISMLLLTIALGAAAESRIATNAGTARLTLGTYEYDGSGNIKAVGFAFRDGTGALVQSATDRYAYDAAGRLISATAGAATAEEQYAYDAFGNITRIDTTRQGQTTTSILPGVDSLTNRMSRNVAPFNASSVYDAVGNDIAYGAVPQGRENTYDMTGMMTSFRDEEFYLYGADDERVARMSMNRRHATYMLRDSGGRVLREYGRNLDTSTAWYWARDYVYADGALIAGVRKTATGAQEVIHYHRDHLGTPRLITDASGMMVSRDDLYPFGTDVEFNLHDPERLHFTGHERDYHTSTATEHKDYLDYMHARYYRPVVGRFLSVDPGKDWDPTQPQSWNLYAYVRNNPVNYLDPDGRQTRSDSPANHCRGVNTGACGRANQNWGTPADPAVGRLAKMGFQWAIAFAAARKNPSAFGAGFSTAAIVKYIEERQKQRSNPQQGSSPQLDVLKASVAALDAGLTAGIIAGLASPSGAAATNPNAQTQERVLTFFGSIGGTALSTATSDFFFPPAPAGQPQPQAQPAPQPAPQPPPQSKPPQNPDDSCSPNA